jgi:hypothetical protein
MTATWTAPRTWTNGELVTDTMLNAHVRDNTDYLYTYGGGAGTAFPGSPVAGQTFFRTDKRLLFAYTGSAWEILAGTIAARYKTSAGQSIADNTVTIVNYDTSDLDTHSRVATGASWKFTAEFAGVYEVQAAVLLTASTAWAATEYAQIQIYKNGAAGAIGSFVDGRTGGSGIYTTLAISTIVQLAASDYLDLRVYQNSGASIALLANASANHLSVARV